MLIDLIHISKSNNNYKFIKDIMEYELTFDLMALATDNMLSLSDRLHFVLLVVEIAKIGIYDYEENITEEDILYMMADICN